MNPGALLSCPFCFMTFTVYIIPVLSGEGNTSFFQPESSAFLPGRYGAFRPCRVIISRKNNVQTLKETV